MNPFGHFKTVSNHRRLVRQGCFSVGLFWQGITHDLSKYSPSEFMVGARYYQGNQSPNNAERVRKGYSSAWLHHKGRNKHHYEYWIDYSSRIKGMVPVRMPDKYIVEMFMDRVAASKTYNKEKYTDDFPLDYYKRGKDFHLIEDYTKQTIEELLVMLSEKGEEATLEHIRRTLLRRHLGAFIVQKRVESARKNSKRSKHDSKKDKADT